MLRVLPIPQRLPNILSLLALIGIEELWTYTIHRKEKDLHHQADNKRVPWEYCFRVKVEGRVFEQQNHKDVMLKWMSWPVSLFQWVSLSTYLPRSRNAFCAYQTGLCCLAETGQKLHSLNLVVLFTNQQDNDLNLNACTTTFWAWEGFWKCNNTYFQQILWVGQAGYNLSSQTLEAVPMYCL